jgi:phosphatidate cytidylyltransferase
LLWLGGWYLFALVVLVVARGSWEWFRMAANSGYRPAAGVGSALAVGWCVWLQLFGLTHVALFVTAAVMVALSVALTRGVERFTANALISLGALFYLGFLGSAPLLISADNELVRGLDPAWVLVVVLASVWLADAAAYICGSRWGKARLVPTISPGKTRVGFVGGLAGGLLPLVLFRWIPALSFGELLGMLVLVSLAGQLGDIVESAIKRDFGVKDAPLLIPGHGGVLDRFDSLLFAFPAAYLYLSALGLLRDSAWVF